MQEQNIRNYIADMLSNASTLEKHVVELENELATLRVTSRVTNRKEKEQTLRNNIKFKDGYSESLRVSANKLIQFLW